MLNPAVMSGIPPGSESPTELQWTIDMASVNTAIAVNLGILSLNTLEQFSRDTNREKMMDDLLSVGRVSSFTFNQTSSYFGE